MTTNILTYIYELSKNYVCLNMVVFLLLFNHWSEFEDLIFKVK